MKTFTEALLAETKVEPATKFKFSYCLKPGTTRTKSFKTLEAMRKGAAKILGTDTPRFDGDYFVGPQGECLVPCVPTLPKDLFPEVVKA